MCRETIKLVRRRIEAIELGMELKKKWHKMPEMFRIGSFCMYPFHTELWSSFQADIAAVFRAQKFLLYCHPGSQQHEASQVHDNCHHSALLVYSWQQCQ